MSRAAVLCDVHGNLPALEAVLAEPAVAAADRILVGGDVVSGPMPRECLDLLLALGERALFVRGNADRAVLERVEEHGAAWCADRLGEERLAAVRAWPLTVSCDVDGVGAVLLCHATPRSDEEIVTRATPEQELAEAVAEAGDRVVVCGHTHIQFDRRLDAGRVVNAGSVGMPYEGRRGAFWALLGPDVEHRHTEYDVDAAAAAVRASGSPIAPELAQWLVEPPDPEETTAYFEGLRPNV